MNREMPSASPMRLAVLGAGAWGTAVAISAAQRHRVDLWARDAGHAQALQTQRTNTRYLPGMELPANVSIQAGEACADQLQQHDLVILATPVAGLRHQLSLLAGLQGPVAWLCKGFEKAQSASGHGLLPHEVLAQAAPGLRAGVLSGPSFAQEVARLQPTALVAASPHAAVCASAIQAMHGHHMRIYSSRDWVGVEVGGAVKNVLAIATGVLDGLAQRNAASGHGLLPGQNARAALLTRGLAEMTRLGVALGADSATFMGLSGMGDLVLTATGDLSRNRRVGLLLAQGMTAEQAVESLGHVAEGVYCARTVLARAQELGVEMPITRCVVDLLNGVTTPAEAAMALMGRDARPEQMEPQ